MNGVYSDKGHSGLVYDYESKEWKQGVGWIGRETEWLIASCTALVSYWTGVALDSELGLSTEFEKFRIPKSRREAIVRNAYHGFLTSTLNWPEKRICEIVPLDF